MVPKDGHGSMSPEALMEFKRAFSQRKTPQGPAFAHVAHAAASTCQGTDTAAHSQISSNAGTGSTSHTSNLRVKFTKSARSTLPGLSDGEVHSMDLLCDFQHRDVSARKPGMKTTVQVCVPS